MTNAQPQFNLDIFDLFESYSDLEGQHQAIALEQKEFDELEAQIIAEDQMYQVLHKMRVDTRPNPTPEIERKMAQMIEALLSAD
jgi:hypothetical protein